MVAFLNPLLLLLGDAVAVTTAVTVASTVVDTVFVIDEILDTLTPLITGGGKLGETI
jgi:hypothetical protein